jgi:lysine 2,3-aminomutase
MLSRPRNPRDIPLWRDASEADWADWCWQFRRRAITLEELRRVIAVTPDEAQALQDPARRFRFALTPHYATLIDPDDPDCPMRRQAIPTTREFEIGPHERADSLEEDRDSPVPGLVHRYPDRVLLLVTHECALYCRYCTRRRVVGDGEGVGRSALEPALDYIRRTPAIRDVLLSGGDPLGLNDRRLDDLLSALRAIPHVEIVRIGTRMPVTAPQRVTPELCAVLRRHHPLWLNTHFNHPFELAPAATQAAMARLADAGVPLGNQAVLLTGVNDDARTMIALSHALVKARCRPYYLYGCDMAEGVGHFRAPIRKGLEIIEAMRGWTSGYAVPTFVIDAPGGGGKIPLQPEWVSGLDDDEIHLRNWRGETFSYPAA